MERISRTELLMQIAYLVAKRGTCLRLQVGAVIAVENRIVSFGYVGAPSGAEHCNPENCRPDVPCDRTVHAEANAIAFAARKGIATEGAAMYCTHSPCQGCAKLIINSGIQKVFFLERYRDTTPLELLCESDVKAIQVIEFRIIDGALPQP